jgi:hypothetical protein
VAVVIVTDAPFVYQVPVPSADEFQPVKVNPTLVNVFDVNAVEMLGGIAWVEVVGVP